MHRKENEVKFKGAKKQQPSRWMMMEPKSENKIFNFFLTVIVMGTSFNLNKCRRIEKFAVVLLHIYIPDILWLILFFFLFFCSL